MQTDGNLVVRRSDGTLRWQSGTSVPGSTLVLGTDGTLLVRTPGGATAWSSAALGFGTERLVLGADGVLKVWTGFWTATRRLTTTTAVWSSAGLAVSDRLQRTQVLAPGASIVSKDRSHRLTMQTDGNLVLRRGTEPRWQSGTRDASRRAYARLGADGNLVVIGDGDRLLFSAGVSGRGGVLAVVQDDGVFRVASVTGATVWGTGPVK
jgi:kumamolisin